MKQKLLAVLATFIAVTPIVGVKAADISYTVGSEHNFIVNDSQKAKHDAGDESVGVKVIALGEVTDDGYVKALATGAFTTLSNRPSQFVPPEETSYRDLRNFDLMYQDLNGSVQGESSGYIPEFEVTSDYVKNYNQDEKWVDVMSAPDFLSMIRGMKANVTSGQTYSLSPDETKKFNEWFTFTFKKINEFKNLKPDYTVSGIYTSSYDQATGKIWVIDFTLTDTTASNVVVREKAMGDFTATDRYLTIPVLYFNKTYDCKYDNSKKQACYKCGDEYQWLTVGEQASTCEAVSSVTKKSKCVKPSKTGVEDYILEFAIAAGICGLVLVAVKRKSLFSRV